jgi:3-phenylpropionate/trans-cinnamate dioxygenase ferredoxin subunit
MDDFTEVGRTAELVNGDMKEASFQDKPILLARVDDKFYAVQGRCPHMGGNLSKGKLEGTVVTCPLHGSRFDLKDGSVIRWLKGAGLMSAIGKITKPPANLKTYEVKVDNNRIMVKVR